MTGQCTATDRVAPLAHDLSIDARDLLCPLPVLWARKALMRLAPGQVLRLLATDAMAAVDLPHFARDTGHLYLAARPEEGAVAHYLQRGEG